jgi:branched-chain amino acid aminotransferase
VKIETHYSRAMEGGTGGVKAAGNYAGALYPAKLAQDKGYHQLIWTDAKTHTYIEESGTMNVMFIIDDTLITAPVGDTILPGITRDSVLTLAREWGLQVEERKLAVTELIDAITTGRLKEAFGTGTAATIAHIELIGYEGVDYTLPEVSGREFSNKVLTTLDDIRLGKVADTYNWVYKI